jgi:serine/threonine protein kinase
MAPEQMERQVYSKASDVFAFGVLLYEIFAQDVPWKDVGKLAVCQKVMNNERMTPPKRTPRRLDRLMLACWAHDPNERPENGDGSGRDRRTLGGSVRGIAVTSARTLS